MTISNEDRAERLVSRLRDAGHKVARVALEGKRVEVELADGGKIEQTEAGTLLADDQYDLIELRR